MDLVTPGIGLIFWSTLIFIILLIVLKKYAWKPILNAVKSREERIKGALESAEEVREEMARLKTDNELIIKEAKEERNQLLQDAREIKEKLINDAKGQANDEAKKVIEAARIKIESEKESAISEIRKQVAILSVEVAEKILNQKLAETKDQKQLIENYLKEIKLN